MLEPLPFEPINFYDAPGILLNQLIEGRMSARLLREAVFDPNALSPLEREDLGSRFLGPGQGNGIGKAAVGVLTNPLVWLYLLTGPVGAKAIGKGASLFTLAKSHAPQLKRSAGFLAPLQTALEEAAGGPGAEAVLHATSLMQKAAETDGVRLMAAEEALVQALAKRTGLKITSLDLATYRAGDPAAKFVEEFLDTAFADAHELIAGRQRMAGGRTVREYKGVPGIYDSQGRRIRSLEPEGELTFRHDARRIMAKVGEEEVELHKKVLKGEWYAGKWNGIYDSLQDLMNHEARHVHTVGTVESTPLPVPTPVFREEMGEVLETMGGDEFAVWRDEVKRANQSAYVRAFGNEELFEQTGQFDWEDWKVENLVSSLQKYEDGLDQMGSGLFGLEALVAASTPEYVETLGRRSAYAMRVPGRYAQLLDEVKQILDPRPGWDDVYWRSRNVWAPQPVMVGGKRVYPVSATTADGAAAMKYAPWAQAVGKEPLESRVAPLTPKQHHLHIDLLEKYQDKLLPAAEGGDGDTMLKRAREHAQVAYGNNQQLSMGMQGDYRESAVRALHQMRMLWAMDIAPVSERVLKADADTLVNVAPEIAENAFMTTRAFQQLKRGTDLTKLSYEDARGITTRAVINRAIQGEMSPARRDSLRGSLAVTPMSVAGPEYVAMYNSQVKGKEMAAWLADSWLGKGLEKHGGKWGKQFIADMRKFGTFDGQMGWSGVGKGLATWLYTTHLGLNLSSIVMNLTQPLLLAASVGKPGEVFRAYGQAFKQMREYASRRAAMGKLLIRDDQKMRLIEESFPLANWTEGGGKRNLLGIGPRMHDVMDYGLSKPQGWLGRVAEVSLKGFEVSEVFNRVVTGEILRAAHLGRTGRLGATFADDVQRLIYQTQYAADPMNTPKVFRSGPLAHPLARMFMSFPLRSLTNVVGVFPRLGGEENYWRGLFNVVGRGMATSALVYEVGKGIMGVDLSRGLFLSATTDMLGGERMLQDGNEWVPVPPVVDIPLDFLRATASGDMQLMGDTLARLVPGGVAMARTLGVAPEMPRGLAGLPGSMQKTYADWGNPLPDGRVGLFSGDGTLVGYESPAALILKGLGADMGAGRQQAGVDAYLVKQREEILQRRHELLRALGSNDSPRAQRIAADFQAKFGYPLTVTQSQVQSYLRGQVVGRTERILDRTDRQARGMYAAMTDPSGRRTGVEGGLSVGESRVTRDPHRVRGVDEERLRIMEERMRAVGRGATQGGGSFDTFGGFSR